MPRYFDSSRVVEYRNNLEVLILFFLFFLRYVFQFGVTFLRGRHAQHSATAGTRPGRERALCRRVEEVEEFAPGSAM